MIGWADRLCQDRLCQDRPAGVLGTALAATWLDQAAARPFDFFMDEDPDRAGFTYLNRPVVAPSELPPGAIVLLPMPTEIATSVAARLNGAGPARFLAPPPMDDRPIIRGTGAAPGSSECRP